MTPATIIYKPHATHHLRAMKDRRTTARIKLPIPVKIRRRGGRGHVADVTSVVDNVGAGGFYVRLMQQIEPGSNLFALIKFAAGSSEEKSATRIAVRGHVLRVEELPGGVYGVAIRICHYRFV